MKNPKIKIALLPLFVLLSLSLISCSGRTEATKFSGETMGTTYSIKIADEVPNKKLLKKEIDSTLAEVNLEMSTYIPQSEILRFNKFRDTVWFSVSKDFAYVVKTALQVSKISDGYYDITVGPLVNLWGFGPTKKKEIVPTQAEIDSVKNFIGYKLIKARENPPAIKKLKAEVYIDLSSIAKGFGVDKITELLISKGFKNCLVEIGGELRASGKKANGENWLVGVENPNKRSVITAVELNNASIATSGDYLNYFEYEGKRYSHTINPKTGRPITHKLASVSVIAKNCALADAYATAIDVMGPALGFELAEKQNLPVYMIVRDGGKFKIEATESFRKLMKE